MPHYAAFHQVLHCCQISLRCLPNYSALFAKLLCTVCQITLHCLPNYSALFAKLLCTVCQITLLCLTNYSALFAKLLCTACQITMHCLPNYSFRSHQYTKDLFIFILISNFIFLLMQV